MTIREQIEIIQAYERGEEIEWKKNYENSFKHLIVKEIIGDHQFDFANNVYRIKRKRWRAKKDEAYYFINNKIDVALSIEYYDSYDDKRYEIGNYFLTEEDAKKARDLIKECLTKFHQEND